MAVVLSAWVKREAEFYLYCCCRVPLYAANRGACGIELGWLLFDPMVTDQAAAANVRRVVALMRDTFIRDTLCDEQRVMRESRCWKRRGVMRGSDGRCRCTTLVCIAPMQNARMRDARCSALS